MSEPVKMIVQLTVQELGEIIEKAVGRALANGKPDKLLYSTEEAAAKLGVEESWLAAKARAGLVPSRMLGQYRKFSMGDIEAILSESANGKKRVLDKPGHYA